MPIRQSEMIDLLTAGANLLSAKDQLERGLLSTLESELGYTGQRLREDYGGEDNITREQAITEIKNLFKLYEDLIRPMVIDSQRKSIPDLRIITYYQAQIKQRLKQAERTRRYRERQQSATPTDIGSLE